MKKNEELNRGDIVEIINPHKNRSGYEGKFMVINQEYIDLPRGGRTIVYAVLIEGSYKDWNGDYGKQREVYYPEDGVMYKLIKRGLNLVRRKGS